MTDLLIRDIDAETVRRIDADAARPGLSRSEYLRREVIRLGRCGSRPTTDDDLRRAMQLLGDLKDEAVMRRAWL